MGASRENAFTNVRATRLAAPRWPELNAGCPQHTCASGNSTSKPAWRRNSSASAAASGNTGRRDTSQTAGRAPSARLYGSWLPVLSRCAVALTGRDDVYLKREDVHELGAFKWRGALPALERYRRDGASGVVTASTGNHGAATAWAAQRSGWPRPLRSQGASRTKLAQLSAARGRGRRSRRRPRRGEGTGAAHAHGRAFRSSRTAPSLRSSTATRAIGDEILDQLGEEPAAVVVPVGNGALLAGVGRALGARSPVTRRIGVVSAGAPVMAWSWRAGAAGRLRPCDTIADGLAVRVAIPSPSTGCWMRRTTCSKSPSAISRAAVVAFDDAGIRAEAAAAAALAALPGIDAAGPVVLVVTGRNIDDELLARCRPAARRPAAAGRCARAGSRA